MPSIERPFVEREGLTFLEPESPLFPGLRVAVTTRGGGVSAGSRAGLNLAVHVGDEPAAVATNRRRLQQALALPAEPCWLQQVHGIAVAQADAATGNVPPTADAAVTRGGAVLAVLTADCLPVVLAMPGPFAGGWCFGVAHAGWRGLAGGVLETTRDALLALGGELSGARAWLGPAIGPEAFEVGAEVREAFLAAEAAAASAFTPNPRGRWQADLFALARQRLARAGIAAVAGGGISTVADATRWYSYRRDATPQADTGRFATLAWIERDSLARSALPQPT